MKELARLNALYSKIDGLLGASRQPMSSAEAEGIRVDQAYNDQAYFILCWGQLEQAIDDKCRDAIRRRRSHADWQVRRGWDIYNPDDPRLSGLPFESRVALVLDRAEGRGQPYALTMRHYEARNRIAHGRLDPARIDLASVIRDFLLIQAALNRSA